MYMKSMVSFTKSWDLGSNGTWFSFFLSEMHYAIHSRIPVFTQNTNSFHFSIEFLRAHGLSPWAIWLSLTLRTASTTQEFQFNNFCGSFLRTCLARSTVFSDRMERSKSNKKLNIEVKPEKDKKEKKCIYLYYLVVLHPISSFLFISYLFSSPIKGQR